MVFGVFDGNLAWLHEQLGACGEPQQMWVTDPRAVRWTHACERGALETWFRLDEHGQIAEYSVGASGVAAPSRLLAAAEVVASSLPWTSAAERPFTHNLGRGDAIGLGTCTLVRPWAFGPRQGFFHLDCEHGDARVLLVDVDRDGLLTRAWMMPASFYKGPPVDGM